MVDKINAALLPVLAQAVLVHSGEIDSIELTDPWFFALSGSRADIRGNRRRLKLPSWHGGGFRRPLVVIVA